jgi:hypothetical protein
MGEDAWKAFVDFASGAPTGLDHLEPWEIRTRPRRKPKLLPEESLRPPREAAAKLQITIDQLFEFVRLGELRYVNVGRGEKKPRYRFADADLDAFIEQRR